ncbi:MAG: hypothetical protein D6791_15860 [Chloroflexi bacterium]|nr:MAG: hypothetical protein D6791_15860 [Chloroflexota bacterium]
MAPEGKLLARLEVRLLGGFEVRHGDQPVEGFESQKVRALLAYLMLHRETPQSRDRLAGLLWPDKDDDTARRNLRQAVYNLRTSLPHGDTASPPILSTHQTVQFNSASDHWLDVQAFEDAIRRGMSASGGLDPHHLAGASELYRGDFLAGFFVRDSPAFEHWLLYEQERLREMAIHALRRLVDYYLTSGAYRRGIRYARRLLEIDPLFEEAHRKLMRLYALSGRRNSALAQYRDCRTLLQTELGVEPLEETTALYQAILAEEWPARSIPDEGTPAGPVIPFVGRHKAYARLRRSWWAARKGTLRVTLVEGEAGIGKSRLIEAFLRDVASQAEVVVLSGRCYEDASWAGCGPIAEALRGFAREEPHRTHQALAHMPAGLVAEVGRVVPEVYALCPDLPPPGLMPGNEARKRQSEAIARLLRALACPVDEDPPVDSLILFLDDLQWGDRPTLELLDFLVHRLNDVPLWVVAAYRPDALDPEHPLVPIQRRLSRDPRVDCVALDRLSASDIHQIAAEVVGDEQAGMLAHFLDRESAGLPLAIAELIHLLSDEGVLVTHESTKWTVAGSLPAFATPTSDSLHTLILRRVSQLPTSARRLLTLAAVIGPQFDLDLLEQAAGEHRAVVDAAAETWVERRLVRPLRHFRSVGVWPASHELPKDVQQQQVLEFAHDKIRVAIYSDLNPRRRQVIHRQVATALESRHRGETDQVCEALAHHYATAGIWDKALVYLQQAGDKARQALANESAFCWYNRALEALDHLEQMATSEETKADLLKKRFQILASRAEIYETPGMPETREDDLQRLQAIARELGDQDDLSMILDRLTRSKT